MNNETERKQYKRDMMLQLVRNEALTEVAKQLPFHEDDLKFMAETARKLTEEEFK